MSLDLATIKLNAEACMAKAIAALSQDLAKLRAGRAHPGLLDHVMVEVYGSSTPLPRLASVSLLDARAIGVRPHDKSMAGRIEKAIRDSDLGLNPAPQGDLIRVPMPLLTEERRQEMSKVAGRCAEAARVAARMARKEANGEAMALCKAKACSDDEARRASTDIQRLLDKAISDMDKMAAQKEAEILDGKKPKTPFGR